MEKIELAAEKRTVLGKKARFVRKQGLTPANIYGHGIESTALQIRTSDLIRTVVRAGKTGLITLKVQGEKSPRMVIIKDFQRHPLTEELLHVDLYQVKMKEKMRAEVPVSLVGEAPAVKDLDGILIQSLNSVDVECLPSDIPHSVEVDLSVLDQLDQSIYVKDLRVPEDVALLTDPERVVVGVSGRRMAAVEEEVAEEEEAEAEAEAEGEAAEEGEAAAEESESE